MVAKEPEHGTGQRIGAVTTAHRFDEAALDRWMRDNIDGYDGRLQVSQFSGGASNPTFLLTCGARRYVLRKRPPGHLLPSAHQVDREFRVIDALQGSGVPVPEVCGFCADPAIIGTSFYVMNFLEGRIFRDATLPDLEPTMRTQIYDDLNATLAKLHRVDWKKAGLEDYGRPGNYFERQVARWTRQYRDSQLPAVPAMEELIRQLPERIPQDNSAAISHGDFRIENVMYHPVEPRIIAVLDWELSKSAIHSRTWDTRRFSGTPTIRLGAVWTASRWRTAAFRLKKSGSLPTAGERDEPTWRTGASMSLSRPSGWRR